jgi:hypothetical protein
MEEIMKLPKVKLELTKRQEQIAKKLLKESWRRFPDDEAAAREWFIQHIPWDKLKFSEKIMKRPLRAALCAACEDAIDVFPDRVDKNKAVKWVLDNLETLGVGIEKDDPKWIEAAHKGMELTYATFDTLE